MRLLTSSFYVSAILIDRTRTMDLLVGNRGFGAEAPDCDNGTSPESCTWLTWTTIGASGTEVPPSLAERDEMLVRAEIAVQASIFVLAVAGNGLVLGLLATMSRRKELGRMYTMIGHLSCADLFVAVFNLLPQVRTKTAIIILNQVSF